MSEEHAVSDSTRHYPRTLDVRLELDANVALESFAAMHHLNLNDAINDALRVAHVMPAALAAELKDALQTKGFDLHNDGWLETVAQMAVVRAEDNARQPAKRRVCIHGYYPDECDRCDASSQAK